MKAGDLVTILVPLDTRVRGEKSEALAVGTVHMIYGDEVQVLLPDGNIWKGLKRNIARAKEQA